VLKEVFLSRPKFTSVLSRIPFADWLRSIYLLTIFLANRFYVAVRLFSNRSQMTSICGKNKKVAHVGVFEVSVKRT